MKYRALVLSDPDREALQGLVRRPRTPQTVALRARIVLACCEGRTNQSIARELGVSLHTVGKWRRRYMQFGLDGLNDQPRSGKPRRFPREHLEALIQQTILTPRPHGQRWSVRSVARAVGISSATIGRAWRELHLRLQRDGRSRTAIAAVDPATFAHPVPTPFVRMPADDGAPASHPYPGALLQLAVPSHLSRD